MGRRGYPPEFRRRVLDLIEAGRKVADVARDLEISTQTIYNWRQQDRIDKGLEPVYRAASARSCWPLDAGSPSSRASSRSRAERWS